MGRSIEGALAGAIIAIELYKKANGIMARTGAIYALPIALGIAVGRIGCLLSGLEDHTHGVPTSAAWAGYVGWDFGDGIPRHPVQLYESLAMAGFAAVYAIMVARGSAFWKTNGFYLMVGFYGLQRFGWELLKPYEGAVVGLSVFQLLSLALIAYAGERMITGHRTLPVHTEG
jgi:prolipoprotein diacylglyceryltransferase